MVPQCLDALHCLPACISTSSHATCMYVFCSGEASGMCVCVCVWGPAAAGLNGSVW